MTFARTQNQILRAIKRIKLKAYFFNAYEFRAHFFSLSFSLSQFHVIRVLYRVYTNEYKHRCMYKHPRVV